QHAPVGPVVLLCGVCPLVPETGGQRLLCHSTTVHLSRGNTYTHIWSFHDPCEIGCWIINVETAFFKSTIENREYFVLLQALSYFEAAEKADPGFYMVNWLWIGKCHLALGKREEAEPWLEKTVSYETTLEEELEAKKEAAELLKKL
ncbi:Regulator of microtubule dynamics protein 1, partial [Geodia barretti]